MGGDFFQYNDDKPLTVTRLFMEKATRKVIREELKEFKKKIIEEIEKRYCENWCVRKD